MNTKIFHAKYESAEFISADALLVSGGFLLGTNLADDLTTPLGSISIAIGLFLGLRVLLKFSSDLKNTKSKVDNSTKILQETNNTVLRNKQSVDDATQKLRDTITELNQTKRDLEQTKKELKMIMKEFSELKEKVFGYGSSMAFSNSSGFESLDETVDELKTRLDKLERKERGW